MPLDWSTLAGAVFIAMAVALAIYETWTSYQERKRWRKYIAEQKQKQHLKL